MLYKKTPPTVVALSGFFFTSSWIFAKSASLFKVPDAVDGAAADGDPPADTTFLKSMYAPKRISLLELILNEYTKH